MDSMPFPDYQWRFTIIRETRSIRGDYVANFHNTVRHPLPYICGKNLMITNRLLLFASGIPTAEKPTAKKYFLTSNGVNAKAEHADAWPNYKNYLRSTSILIPIPPALYRPLPRFIKQYILLDLPVFQFDETVDGRGAIEEDRKKTSES